MSKKNNRQQFSSYRKKGKFDKLSNPQRADWSGLLRELRGESKKAQEKQNKDDDNLEEAKNHEEK